MSAGAPSTAMPPRAFVALFVGLAAASQSGTIIRLGTAHPVTIAAWRLLLATLVLLPLWPHALRELRRASRRDRLLTATSGVVLALHFFTWIGAVQHTTVANATLIFAVNPVLTAVVGHRVLGDVAPARVWLSVGLGAAGVGVVASDSLVLGRSLVGDGLALVSVLLFASYALISRYVQRRVATGAYVTVIYGIGGLVGLAVMLALGEPLFAYDGRTYLCFGLMAAVPTLLGHTGLNHALRYLDATRVSLAILSEPLLAALVAWWAYGEALTGRGLAGYLIVLVSVALAFLRPGVRPAPALVQPKS